MDVGQSAKWVCKGCKKEVKSPLIYSTCTTAYHKSCAFLNKELHETVHYCTEDNGRKVIKLSTQQGSLDGKVDDILKTINGLKSKQIIRKYLKSMIKEIIIIEIASIKEDIQEDHN